jgi:hypothetical protein
MKPDTILLPVAAILLTLLLVFNVAAGVAGAVDGHDYKDCTPNRRGLWLIPAYPVMCWLASPWDDE